MCIRDRNGPIPMGLLWRPGREIMISLKNSWIFGAVRSQKNILIPVSYTHLDVYKRQDKDSGKIFGAALFCPESYEIINMVKLAMDHDLDRCV